MTILYVLLSILLLGILIMVHEWGHFSAARLMKIEVREFSLGMGPKLLGWKSKKHETDFSLRLIPMGGYCAFYGEDDVTGEGQNDPRAFPKQNVWKRFFTVFMGPCMNFILALVVAVICYMTMGTAKPTGQVDLYVNQVMGAGPAWEAGLQDGDRIVSVGVQSMEGVTVDAVLNLFGDWKEGDGPVEVVLGRGEETVVTQVTPYWDETEKKNRIGIILSYVPRSEHITLNFGQSVAAGFSWCVETGKLIFVGLGELFTGKQGMDQVSGPVGVVSMVTELVMDNGLTVWVELMVLLSVNLGVMNLLPIPGLDGSRLLFNLIEGVRGKPVPQKKEALIHTIGLVALLLFMVFLTVKDVIGLFK